MGLRGRVTAESLKSIVPDFMERRIFVCGPNPFMSATKEIAAQLGFPMERYHEESFGGAKKFKPIPQPPQPNPALNQLRQAKRRICVAGGKSKRQALAAALKGKWLDVLVTDVNSANYLLSAPAAKSRGRT